MKGIVCVAPCCKALCSTDVLNFKISSSIILLLPTYVCRHRISLVFKPWSMAAIPSKKFNFCGVEQCRLGQLISVPALQGKKNKTYTHFLIRNILSWEQSLKGWGLFKATWIMFNSDTGGYAQTHTDTHSFSNKCKKEWCIIPHQKVWMTPRMLWREPAPASPHAPSTPCTPSMPRGRILMISWSTSQVRPLF